MSARRLSDWSRGRIVRLYQNGYTKAEIARMVGCSHWTVCYWLKKYGVFEYAPWNKPDKMEEV